MSERWTVSHAGDVISGPGDLGVEAWGSDSLAADVCARLNGPSPAEVAALLREVEWRNYFQGERCCPACSTAEGYPHEADCKLDAMIKQCEGA